jgi:hypothetical protein
MRHESERRENGTHMAKPERIQLVTGTGDLAKKSAHYYRIGYSLSWLCE